MSESVNLNIRIDADLKKQFETFCDEIGISMSSAFCLFAKQAVLEQRIPFIITTKKGANHVESSYTRIDPCKKQQ